MSLNVDNFKANLTGGGARPNLFKVICTLPPGVATGLNLSEASFMIKAASLPPSTLAAIEVPFRGRQLKVAGDRTFENWSITVINDNSMSVRNAFERWSDRINANKQNTGILSPRDYQADMIVQQLDRQNRVVKQYTMRGAWPVTVSNIELNYETTNQIEEFTVELAYQYWESNTTAGGGLSGILSRLPGLGG
jgi:hypothetical protein